MNRIPLLKGAVPVPKAAILGILFVFACGHSSGTVAPSAPTSAKPAPSPTHQLLVGVAGTQFAVGANRLPIGIADHNTPVTDAAVHVRVFTSSGGLKGEADAPYRGDGLEGHGLYVAPIRFDVPGLWQALITARLSDGTQTAAAVQFGVRKVTEIPMVGQPAPLSHNQTAADVPDVSYIDSGQPPDDMHAISIADAIAQHRPTLVVFAAPAFCQSLTCGPQVHVVEQLEPLYRDRLTFIHVETYRDEKPDPARRRVSPTMLEWHLQTDPWVFLIDRDGTISAEFEAATAIDELKPAIDRLLRTG